VRLPAPLALLVGKGLDTVDAPVTGEGHGSVAACLARAVVDEPAAARIHQGLAAPDAVVEAIGVAVVIRILLSNWVRRLIQDEIPLGGLGERQARAASLGFGVPERTNLRLVEGEIWPEAGIVG
jgi:hypothetical protein